MPLVEMTCVGGWSPWENSDPVEGDEVAKSLRWWT